MNSWQKAITIISAALCILALVLLCLLAFQTTAVDEKASQPIAAWPELLKTSGDHGVATESSLDLLPLLADTGKAIIAALAKINASPNARPNELELTFKTPEALKAFLQRAPAAGITVLNSDPRLLSAVVRYYNPVAMAQELTTHAGGYGSASPNYLVWIPGLPNESQPDANNAGGREPFGSSGMEAIGAAADRSTWGKGVTLAILDSGVMDHPSLSQTKIAHYDLVNDGATPNGHGTAMASLAVGSGDENGGAAQATHLLDIRVADTRGESNTALVAQAIMDAVGLGVDVINISMGTNGNSPLLQRAIEYALAQGVVVVAAAGNDQQASLAYPARYPGVVSVGAVDATGTQAYFSNSGDTLTVAAPGVGIISAYGADQTVIGSGTSQATAITSGVVSTLLGWGYSAQSIAATLASTAQPTGAPKEQVGAGMLHLPIR